MSAIWSRINTLLLLVVLIAVIGGFATRAWGGPLDPPGAPGPTQPQVEPRSPIPPVGWDGSFPITISEPGSYYLTQDLTDAVDTDGIDIGTSDVALDLNGFTLKGAAGLLSGIRVNVVGAQGIVVRNGLVTSWGDGVDLRYSHNAQADSLIVTYNSGGIGLVLGAGGMAHHITAEHNATGIALIDSTPTFEGGLIDGCVATNNDWGIDIFANNVTVEHCNLDSNANGGLDVHPSKAFDVIMDNTVQGDPVGVYLESGTSGDTVIRNVFALNTTTAVLDSGTANRVGPLASVASAGAWSNIGP